MQRAAGFSLIEVLVVIAITSTLAVGASLVWTRSSGNDGGTIAFLRDVEGLQRRAMLSGVDHRLVLTGAGWQAERRASAGWDLLPGSGQSAHIDRAPKTLTLHADGRIDTARIIFGKPPNRAQCRTGSGGAPICSAM